MGSTLEEYSDNLDLPSKVLTTDWFQLHIIIIITGKFTNSSGLACLNVIISFKTYIFSLPPIISFL